MTNREIPPTGRRGDLPRGGPFANVRGAVREQADGVLADAVFDLIRDPLQFGLEVLFHGLEFPLAVQEIEASLTEFDGFPRRLGITLF